MPRCLLALRWVQFLGGGGRKKVGVGKQDTVLTIFFVVDFLLAKENLKLDTIYTHVT